MALRVYWGLAVFLGSVLAVATSLGACIDRSLAIPEEAQQGGQTDQNNVIPTPTTPDNPSDMDHDGVPNAEDNCPVNANPDQMDTDGDGVGDVCDDCPTVFDPEQGDEDNNGQGDACQH